MNTHDHASKKQAETNSSRASEEEPIADSLSGLGSFHAVQRALKHTGKEKLSSKTVLQLQRTIGNRAVLQLYLANQGELYRNSVQHKHIQKQNEDTQTSAHSSPVETPTQSELVQQALNNLETIEQDYQSTIPALMTQAGSHTQQLASHCTHLLGEVHTWIEIENEETMEAFSQSLPETVIGDLGTEVAETLAEATIGKVKAFVAARLYNLWQADQNNSAVATAIQRSQFRSEQAATVSDAVVRHMMTTQASLVSAITTIHSLIIGMFGTNSHNRETEHDSEDISGTSIAVVRAWLQEGGSNNALNEADNQARRYFQLKDSLERTIAMIEQHVQEANRIGHEAISDAKTRYLQSLAGRHAISFRGYAQHGINGFTLHVTNLNIGNFDSGLLRSDFRALSPMMQEHIRHTNFIDYQRSGVAVEFRVRILTSPPDSPEICFVQSASGEQEVVPDSSDARAALSSLIPRDWNMGDENTRAEGAKRAIWALLNGGSFLHNMRL